MNSLPRSYNCIHDLFFSYEIHFEKTGNHGKIQDMNFTKAVQTIVSKTKNVISRITFRPTIKKGLQRIATFREKKNDPIEIFAKENALYNPNEWKESDISSFLQKYELKLIGEGLHARAFRIVGEDWVVKEARWDLKMDLFRDVKVSLPVRLAEKILKIFAFKFLPDKEFVQDDFRKYLEFAQYFGYFEREEDFPHKNREVLFNTQKNIRSTLAYYKADIEKKYKFTIDEKINEILSSRLKQLNFIPREFQLIGKSFSPENKDQTTSFIFQRYIQGSLLCDVPEEQMTKRLKKQLILMMYLILLMNMQIHILPDTRPRHPLRQSYNWLLKTDNIIVQNNKVYFIDTRWFWETRANLLKRGIIISNMTVNNCKIFINKLLNEL